MAEETKNIFFKGPSVENDAQTGLSHFILSTTYVENGAPKEIQLHGLLSELPEISFTVNYEDGPGSEWQDILSNFMANDLISIFNAIGAKGDNFTNLVKTGTWTKQVYNGYTQPTIPLKFRIYTRDSLGQTAPNVWIAALSKFAALDTNNQFKSENAIENIFGSIANAYNTGGDAANVANNANVFMKQSPPADSRTEEQKTEEDGQKKNAQVRNTVTKINNIFKTKMGHVNGDTKSGFHVSTMHLDIRSGGAFGGRKNVYLVMKIEAPGQKTYSETPKGGVDVGHLDSVGFWSGEFDLNDIYIHTDEIIKAIKDVVNKMPIEGESRNTLNNIFKDNFYDEITNAGNEVNTTQTDNGEELNISKFLKATANDLGNVLIGKYGPNRVFEAMNRSNCLGEKLWHLNIYDNVIFNRNNPLVVYVSEWSVKASDERDYSQPVYYDFEVTCAMDQIYSRNTWFKILENAKERESGAGESLGNVASMLGYNPADINADALSKAAAMGAAAANARRR